MARIYVSLKHGSVAYAGIVREQETKCFLKTAEVLLDPDRHTYLSLINKRLDAFLKLLRFYWMLIDILT